MPSQNEIKIRIDHCKEVCVKAGVKLTHQRIEIFREVVSKNNHPDAEIIYKGVRKRIPTVSKDTIYRTLWLFHDLGLISTLGIPHDRSRFDANMKPHHHFICTKCGMVVDFYSQEFDDLNVPVSVQELGNVEARHVELKGLCNRCAKQGK